MVNPTEEIPIDLQGRQKDLYVRYHKKGYSPIAALYLAQLFGQTRTEQSSCIGLEFAISDPEIFVKTHLPSLLVLAEFQSPGILMDTVGVVLSNYAD